MTLAVDISNYSSAIGPKELSAFVDSGVGLIIIQAFPTSYHQYAQQQQQVQAVSGFGLPFDYYVFDYLTAPGWRDGAIAGMAPLPTPRRIWADEEDTTISHMSTSQQVAAVRASLQALDRVPTRLNPTGVYTGSWWWTSRYYLANYQGFADRPLWVANYDGVGNTDFGFQAFGGWTHATIKQYVGTTTFDGVSGVDLDVLSAEEVGNLTPVEVQPSMAINVGQGMKNQMAAAGDAPLFGHKFYGEVDDDAKPYQVEECYGTKGRYVSSDVSGTWVNAGPF